MSKDNERWVHVDIQQQRLSLFEGEQPVAWWPVSTARNGPGERSGSECTPRGEHRVRIKIGEGCADNTVFVGRRPTGELYSEQLARAHPRRDWILTRILWLSGCEPGRNRGGDCDTLRRFIYIHGCPDSLPMGIPESHGCIRMRNADLIDLFAQVQAGTRVRIDEHGNGRDG
jgi:lipoprotein-anchoring transpeptidase ErfK/SrfK